MIEISVNSSPDIESKGKYRYYKNFIRIGNNNGDVIISDPEIINSHLILEISEEGVLAKKNPQIASYLVNEKKTTGNKKLKLGDKITLGTTTFQILFFEFTKASSKKETINQNLEMIMSDQSFENVQHIIEFIEEDLSKIKIKKD